MSLETIATWALRVFGLLYVAGGVFAVRQMLAMRELGDLSRRLDRMTEEFAREQGEAPPPTPVVQDDPGRHWWLITGGALLIPAGVSMALAHRLSVAFLSAIIVHQMFYFLRQRGQEMRARTEAEKAEARPARATVNGFFAALVVTVMAAWLSYVGALS